MARKTNTPLWFSVMREVMIYLGGSTFLLLAFKKLHIKDTEFALQSFLTFLAIIEIVKRLVFRADKKDNIYKQ